MSSDHPNVTVIGSINMDLVIRCATLPQPGQTILAASSAEVCGGKGANQAVAAARAGGKVTMIGRVGDDAFANRLRKNLVEEGVACGNVQSTAGCASGLAVVAVENGGQNLIMVVPGANARVSAEDVVAGRTVIESSDILLLQLEIPIETALAAIEIARAVGVRVILDPAPAPRIWPEQLLDVDLICPNASEAASLSRRPVESIQQAEAVAWELQRAGARHVAITMGEQGTMLLDGSNARLIEPYAITAIDTTAAGDAFAGALAVRWTETADLDDAVRFANAAGALAASREGAQPGMGLREEIETVRNHE